MTFEIVTGDCIEELFWSEDSSIDSVVTDPPYGINMMNKAWDGPSGMLGQIATGTEQRGAFAYGGTHSHGLHGHDNLAFQEWVQQWAAECFRVLKPGGHMLAFGATRTAHRLAAGIEDAGFEIRDSIAWMYGTGMPKAKGVFKPAWEPIVVARKPVQGTIKGNVARWGTGMLNVDENRIPHADEADRARSAARNPGRTDRYDSDVYGGNRTQQVVNTDGRTPANVVLDPEAALALGEYARYFYVTKAPAAERPKVGDIVHPTVKPLSLMRHLVRLATPAGGMVLDPFAGSGTTAEACLLEGFDVLAIEKEPAYRALIEARIERALTVAA
jgi:DNA modification methylase